MFKGLILDLDGVLTNLAVCHLTVWNDLVKELGISLTDEQLGSLRGISRMGSLNLILKYDGQENKYSEAGKEKLAEEKNIKFVEQVEKMTPTGILLGIPELFSDAKKQNLKMAIASTSKNAPKILAKLGIMDEFDGIVDPAALHRGKSDPEIYGKIQELLGLDADEVISFEDAQADVQSTKSIGRFAVGIGDKEVLRKADYIVPTTKGLKLSEIESVFNKKQEGSREREWLKQI